MGNDCVRCTQLTALGTCLKICDGDIGTDSRVGVGFRLGEHADFQVLLELGPQLNTQPLGPAGDTKTRRQVQRPGLVVLPATGSETVADTPGGKWLSSWRSALVNSQTMEANRYIGVGQHQVIQNPMKGKDHVTSQLQQLYKNGSKATEKSNSEGQTSDGGPAGRGNFTSVET
ncbi:uncharacterized protein LOC110832995 [Zootermopsis nevadensis]|uniref:uncharacterized protein LOC110832995 n=1 Tax=Zootermopsis nevadensis TaxID=136037 RepID=UPI000B8EE717|nr:uncharacterized protein LOC110832995 [Zootermopsis nevadensis]